MRVDLSETLLRNNENFKGGQMGRPSDEILPSWMFVQRASLLKCYCIAGLVNIGSIKLTGGVYLGSTIFVRVLYISNLREIVLVRVEASSFTFFVNFFIMTRHL